MQVDNLDVFANPRDIRRDLHAFVTYIANHDVTRTYRDNRLPKTHAMRLARTLGDPDAIEEVKHDGGSGWLDRMDTLSLRLKLVRYKTEGVYAGYSSTSESYPDNDVFFEDVRYKKFLRLSLQAQEDRILSALLNDCGYDNNEFLTPGPLSRLDRFDAFGCATGVMPLITFSKIRRRLLELLAGCEAGVWYSVSSLVEHLKANDPFFLIPKALPKEAQRTKAGRYQNFSERPRDNFRGPATRIEETDPQAFERVEGRFVERFLEGIPLEMGYVDVAYARGDAGTTAPSRGLLKAFRLTPRFLPAIRGTIPEPKVTVLPNFEVHIESAFYPAGTLAALAPLGNITTEDVNTILKLDKQNVARTVAENPSLDVPALLRDVASNPLPANVERELEGWVGHSESFVLYEGFGLIEADGDTPEAAPFIVERVSPSIAVVATPAGLHDRLEAAGRIPERICHADNALRPAPEGASSVFTVQKSKKAASRKRAAVVKRSVRITLHFPTRRLFNDFLKALLDAECVLESNPNAMTFSYSKEHDQTVAAILAEFRKKQALKLEETA